MFSSGRPAVKLAPGLTAIGRLVNAGFRAAVHEGRDGSVPLPGGGVQRVGIAGIDDHIGHAGPLAATENLVPGRTSVGRTKRPRSPPGDHSGTLCGDENAFESVGSTMILEMCCVSSRPMFSRSRRRRGCGRRRRRNRHVVRRHSRLCRPRPCWGCRVEGDAADRIRRLRRRKPVSMSCRRWSSSRRRRNRRRRTRSSARRMDAISAMRPDMNAGPIPRSLRPEGEFPLSSPSEGLLRLRRGGERNQRQATNTCNVTRRVVLARRLSGNRKHGPLSELHVFRVPGLLRLVGGFRLTAIVFDQDLSASSAFVRVFCVTSISASDDSRSSRRWRRRLISSRARRTGPIRSIDA